MRNVITVAAATVFAATLFAAPAQADPVVHYRQAGTNMCLADTGTQGVRLVPCNQSAQPQRWLLPVGGDLTDRPRNMATGRCLAARPTGQVLTEPCSTTGYQRWRREPRATEFRFHNVGANKCLVSTTARTLSVQACTPQTQRWTAFY
jgi:hypothetical protein